MRVASLRAASDGLRFEVHSKPSSNGASAVPKLIVKSSHRTEIARWVQTIRLNIEYYSQSRADASGDEQSARSVKRSMSTTRDRLDIPHLPPPDTFLSPTLKRTATGLSAMSIQDRPSGESRHLPGSKRSASPSGYDTVEDAGGSSSEQGGDRLRSNKSFASLKEGIPHSTSFRIGAENIQTQIELTEQLIDSIVISPVPAGNGDEHQMVRSPSRQQAVKNALRDSLATLRSYVSNQHTMSLDREHYLLSRIEREVEARKLWEENMLTVAKQQAETDRQLGEAARDNEKKRKALRQARGVLAGLSGNANPSTPGGTTLDDILQSPPNSSQPKYRNLGAGILDVPPLEPSQVPAATTQPEAPADISATQALLDDAIASDDESDEDDEFFDAIESGTLPLKINPMIANPPRPGTPLGSSDDKQLALEHDRSDEVPGSIVTLLNRPSLEPYKHVRNKLPIDDDKRPSVSCKSTQ